MACSKLHVPSCDWLADVEQYLTRIIYDIKRLLDKLNQTNINYLPCSIHKEQKCEITEMTKKLRDIFQGSEHLKRTIKKHIDEHDVIFRVTPGRLQDKNIKRETGNNLSEPRDHQKKDIALPCATSTELNQIKGSKPIIPSCDWLADVDEVLNRGIADVRKLVDKMSQPNSVHLNCSIHKERKCEKTDMTNNLIEFIDCVQKLQFSTLEHLKEHDGVFRDTPGRAEARRHVATDDAIDQHLLKEDSGFSSATSIDLHQVWMHEKKKMAAWVTVSSNEDNVVIICHSDDHMGLMLSRLA
ncbi:hypothetical protein Btru_035551 [Bulinus truncatus]|nr:hypothetical protein Btru_035551 [Bulinus truncatus]